MWGFTFKLGLVEEWIYSEPKPRYNPQEQASAVAFSIHSPCIEWCLAVTEHGQIIVGLFNNFSKVINLSKYLIFKICLIFF